MRYAACVNVYVGEKKQTLGRKGYLFPFHRLRQHTLNASINFNEIEYI